MRLIDVEYDSNSEPFSVTCEEDGAVHVFEIVRHGHWIHKLRQYEMDECNCSECEQLLTTAIGQRMSYCPKCGAKMDGGKNLNEMPV